MVVNDKNSTSANKLLAMAKDINGLRPIVIGEVFF
jgi:hypothetical protein